LGRKHRRWSKAAPISPTALAVGECHLQSEYQLSFWDAQVVQSAASLGCKQIFSEDLNHGQVYGDVQVINPFKELD
jgi:predicted nucleic acid-binding protein